MSSPTILIESWSSLGELYVLVNGVSYKYLADLACIKRFVEMVRYDRKPGLALNYLKTVAKSYERRS